MKENQPKEVSGLVDSPARIRTEVPASRGRDDLSLNGLNRNKIDRYTTGL